VAEAVAASVVAGEEAASAEVAAAEVVIAVAAAVVSAEAAAAVAVVVVAVIVGPMSNRGSKSLLLQNSFARSPLCPTQVSTGGGGDLRAAGAVAAAQRSRENLMSIFKNSFVL